jgi:hypothetical protein
MESLLIEKIAVDYWRLRRVLRFENGAISKYPGISVSDFYKKLNVDQGFIRAGIFNGVYCKLHILKASVNV